VKALEETDTSGSGQDSVIDDENAEQPSSSPEPVMPEESLEQGELSPEPAPDQEEAENPASKAKYVISRKPAANKRLRKIRVVKPKVRVVH
jgi:hypothetical protein